ncbi:MAG: hypothetical protein JWP75_3535, partial [Frondihabitans sp.]|nr:hypothetical protein [Frondihabitans sp.]
PARAVPLLDRLLRLGMTEGIKRGIVFRADLNVLLDAVEQSSLENNSLHIGSDIISDDNGRIVLAGEILTVLQAAVISGRAPVTIRLACREGRLKAELVGKTWLIASTDLDTYRFANGAQHG